MTLTISKESVYAEVRKASAYVGANSGDGDERIEAHDASSEMLDTYFAEAIARAAARLAPWVESAETTAAGAELTMLGRAQVPTMAQEAIAAYCARSVLADWLALAAHPQALATAQSAATLLEAAEALLAEQPRPTRRPPAPFP